MDDHELVKLSGRPPEAKLLNDDRKRLQRHGMTSASIEVQFKLPHAQQHKWNHWNGLQAVSISPGADY